jgi:multisubunit Na+/H+ antiporter MnhB subunit
MGILLKIFGGATIFLVLVYIVLCFTREEKKATEILVYLIAGAIIFVVITLFDNLMSRTRPTGPIKEKEGLKEITGMSTEQLKKLIKPYMKSAK